MTERNVCKEMPLWKWILLLVSGTLFFLLAYSLAPYSSALTDDITLRTVCLFISGIVLIVLYALFVRLFEKRKVSELALEKAIPGIAAGAGLAILIFAIFTAVVYFSGYYRINSFSADYGLLLNNLAIVFIVAAGEELIFRGIMFRMIDQRYGIVPAMTVSSLLFGLAHISNPNATILSAIFIALEAGIFLGVAYKYTQSLWMPIGIHWAWNFTESPILGLPLSGVKSDSYTLFDSGISGPEIITGGDFGPEASIVILILCLCISAIMLYRMYGRNGGRNGTAKQ